MGGFIDEVVEEVLDEKRNKKAKWMHLALRSKLYSRIKGALVLLHFG